MVWQDFLEQAAGIVADSHRQYPEAEGLVALFKSGRLTEISVAGKMLSTYCDTADINIKVDSSDTSTFTATWHTAIVGLAGGTTTMAGNYDPTITNGPASVLLAQIALNQAGTTTAVIFYPAGNNAGQGTSHTYAALLTDYKEGSAVAGKVTFSATLLITGVDTMAQL